MASPTAGSPTAGAGAPPQIAAKDAIDMLRYGDLGSAQIKRLVFDLQGIISNHGEFAEDFLDRGGLQLVVDLVKKASGSSVQGHLLFVLKAMLNYVNAIESVKEQPELVDKIYYLLAPPGDNTPPNLTVAKATIEVLTVLCHILPNGRALIHDAAKRRASIEVKPYAIFAPFLTSSDLLCVRSVLLFFNVLLKKARAETSGGGGEHEGKNLVFRFKDAGLLDLLKPLTSVDDPGIKQQLSAFQKQSDFVVPRSWEAAEKYRSMYEDMRKRYDQANESLFVYQQQQAKVRLLKLEFQRSQETLKLIGAAMPSLSRHPHPTKRFEHGGGLSIKELAGAGTEEIDIPQDAVKETTNMRKALLEKFLTSVDIRSFAEQTLNITGPIAGGGGHHHGKTGSHSIGAVRSRIAHAGGSYFDPAAHLYDDDPPPPTDSDDDMLPTDSDDDDLPSDDSDFPEDDDGFPDDGALKKSKSGKKGGGKAGGAGKGGKAGGKGGKRGGGGRGGPPSGPPSDDDDSFPDDDEFPDDEFGPGPSKKGKGKGGAAASGDAAAASGDQQQATATSSSSEQQPATDTPAATTTDASAAQQQQQETQPAANATAPAVTPAAKTTAAVAATAALPVALPGQKGMPGLPGKGMPQLPGKGMPGLPGMPIIGGKKGGPAVDERKWFKGAAPAKKMRPLHWDKLPIKEGDLTGTIWHKIHEGGTIDAEFDYGEFETMFSQKEVDTTKKDEKKKDQELMLVDPKTFMNFAIMLHKLPPIPTIQRAIQELDTQTLKQDAIQALLNAAEPKSLPPDTIKEFRAKQHMKTVEQYNPPEQFVAMVLSMGDVFKPRLAAWTFTLNWNDAMVSLRAPLVRASKVMDAVLGSQHLPYFLAILLGFGNLMNHGASKGNAPAIMLSALGKLDAAKDNRGKTSLMQHLLNTVRDRNPAALDLAEELKVIWQEQGGAGGLKLDDLEKSVNEADGQFNQFNAHVAAVKRLNADNPMAGSDPFAPTMTQYATGAATDLEEAKGLLETAKGKYKELVKYFGYPEKRAPKLDEMIVELANFVAKVRKLHEEAQKAKNKQARKGQTLQKGGLDKLVGELQEGLVA